MLRRLHSLAGLPLALMLLVIASTGVILSLEPAANQLAYPASRRERASPFLPTA